MTSSYKCRDVVIKKSSYREPILSPRGLHKNCYYISQKVMSYFKKERVGDRDMRRTDEGRV